MIIYVERTWKTAKHYAICSYDGKLKSGLGFPQTSKILYKTDVKWNKTYSNSFTGDLLPIAESGSQTLGSGPCLQIYPPASYTISSWSHTHDLWLMNAPWVPAVSTSSHFLPESFYLFFQAQMKFHQTK